MAIASPFFHLQPESKGEVEIWILVLISALGQKSENWAFQVVHNDGEDLVFECSPPLSNEEVSAVFVPLFS